MKRWSIFVLVVGVGVAATSVAAKEYLKDSKSKDAPKSASQIITVPRYPTAGRKFEIWRTATSRRSDRFQLFTGPQGRKETLVIKDDRGTLEFRRLGYLVHTIKLGPCLSFAMMDRNHDFAARGSPAYFTAPADCRLWHGRSWNQTYRTLVVGWSNPCVYEARRKAEVSNGPNGRRVLARSAIHMTMEKNGRTFDWETWAEYDEKTRFFSRFNVGYVGEVKIIREIK